MIKIRDERPDDYAAIRDLTIAAFESSQFGHNGEAELIEQLRADGDDLISLVACIEGEVVGHVLLSPAEIRTDQATTRGMGLAPMSVQPDRQGSGIGTRLINASLARLADQESPFAIVLGHPDYYPKFGFAPAEEFGIRHGFAGIPQQVFHVRFLNQSIVDQCRGGLACYHEAFGPQHNFT